MALPQPLEPELLEHLRVEFGLHGCRAADLLVDAHAQLVASTPSRRLREIVAHCLREAMTAILDSVDSGEVGKWRDLSREVVEARTRYGMAVGRPGEDAEGALRDLLARIDDLSRFHDQGQGLHERRLIAVVVRRTGDKLLSAGTEPVRAYQDLVGRLSAAAHGARTQESAEELWAECAAVLRRLFLPRDIRNPELERLARISQPAEADTDAVLGLVSSPGHLGYFLDKVESPAWLEVLGEAGVLDPTNTDGAWPPHAAAARLAERFPAEVAVWLQDMYRSYGTRPVAAARIVRAARDAGGPALSLALDAVRDHPEDPGVLMSCVLAAEQADASSALVEDLADLILNPRSWAAARFAERLLKPVSTGINEDNSQRRIAMLVYKLHPLPDNDRLLRKLRSQRSGSIADTPRYSRDDRSRSLLSCLIRLLESAWAWTSAGELLRALGTLPETSLRQRLRAWVLANAPDAHTDLIVDEIEHAIASRSPTGDDLALLDRAAASCDRSAYAARWREALGPVPDVEQVGRALASKEVPAEWRRAMQWVSLLPAEAACAWVTACDVLASRYGRTSREALAQRTTEIPQFAKSPINAEELRSMDPLDAAARVAKWRPGPDDWLGGAHEIAGTLESVVKDDIEGWASAPIRTVVALRHPTYIGRYLSALSSAAPEHELPVGDLLDVIKLIRAHPWPVETLADSPLDYDTDWRETVQAGVSLIEAFADSDRGFDGRADEAWSVLASEASDRSERSDIVSISTGADDLSSAMSRPCTRALEAVISFVAYEYRSRGDVRPEAIALFENSLALVGADGAEHRAMLASRIGFLLHVLPEWTEENRDLLFGSQAPDGLGQLRVELAIKWSQPSEWLLENFPEAVREAVRGGDDRAMEHMVIAMLWGCPGYSVEETAAFLRVSSDLVSESGWALGRVLDGVNSDDDRSVVDVAVDFWNTVLATETGEAVEGFGHLARVVAIDTETWEELTLRTVRATGGRLDGLHEVTDRLAASPPTPTGLAILNELIRGGLDRWDCMFVADQAVPILSRADALQQTDDYQRLRTTLQERNLIDD